MSTIPRYNYTADGMTPAREGWFVYYSDYEALTNRIAELEYSHSNDPRVTGEWDAMMLRYDGLCTNYDELRHTLEACRTAMLKAIFSPRIP